MTDHHPVRHSPLHAATSALGARYTARASWQIPEVYTSVAAELAAARAGLALADVSSLGKLYVEGAAAATALQAAFGQAPMEAGAGARAGDLAIFQIRPELFFVLTPVAGEAEAQARLTVARGEAFVTITDLTHGLAGLSLIGPQARMVLSQLSGLNFAAAAFPDLSLRATSLAKTRQIIVRQDRGGLPAFSLFGPQSLAAYVWDAVQTAGRPGGLVPLGLSVLNSLED